jgi:hypothetical protein
MRKVSVLLVGLVVGAVVGAVGWQVGFAVEPPVDTLVVCERPGTDLRSPAANGTCPSGYTKKEITETTPDSDPIFQASSPAPVGAATLLTNTLVASLNVPEGAYLITASGTITDTEVNLDGAQTTCDLRLGPTSLDTIHVRAGNTGFLVSEWTMTGAAELSSAGTLTVHCSPVSNDANSSSTYAWTITAVQGDSLNPLL